MAKFSGSVVQPGQVSEAQQETIANVPVQQIQESTPQASPAEMSLSEFLSTPSQPELPAGEVTPEAIGEGIEAGIAAEQQVARERIPTLQERAADKTTIHKWDPKKPSSVPRADGGLKARAANLAAAFSTTNRLGITPSSPESRVAATTGDTSTVASLEAQTQAGSLSAALNRSGAVTSTQDPVSRTWTNAIDPMMLNVGSAVTENMLSEASFGDTAEGVADIDPELPTPTITKAQNNAALGQQIHREYMRIKNQSEGKPTDQYEDLPRAEATTLGDAFKEMWADTNPNLIKRERVGDQVHYQLTPEGVEAMKKGAVDRKRLFPKTNVRPAKAPTATGQLPGEQGRTATKKTTGKVKQPLVGAKVLVEATKNLNAVPNVVDRQREKILYLTILPVLKGELDWTTWQAEINNVGAGKMTKFQAAEAAYHRSQQEGAAPATQPYSAESEMQSLQTVIAQEVRSIAQERDGANHLTYGIQSFNGRISPQQTYFDPTSSKAVRFVTRNVVPAPAAPGSRVERNLREMYAMMLVKGADALLPKGRLDALDKEASRLEAWGVRLQEVVDQGMSDAELDAVAQAISDGIPLTDPKFPQVRGINLDPQQDGDLIRAITSKGEDGPHFIDGLMDFAKFNKARREGRTYHSYFNAYVDGKTNGIASNGIQMGSEQVAYATGVLRNNTDQLLDDGDIRDQLKADLLERLDNDGIMGSLDKVDAQALYDTARAVFSYRNLNKATTMTFGYGKEMNSFKKDIEDTIDILAEEAKGNPDSTLDVSVATLDKEMGSREKLVETLHDFYVGSLANALSDEAIQSRALMRSASMLHALTNQLFSIQGPTGFQLNMGAEATLGYNPETATTYRVDGKKVTAGQYETESTAAAIRTQTDSEGNVTQTPGEDAYGGSVPAPVQSLDAATVALSAAGRSWDKLKSASNGNPYMHTIYDAFKLDAMGFDVGVAEINKNWLETSMNWSYLEETHAATKAAMEAWSKETQQLNQGELVDITMAGPYRMMGWLLQHETTEKGLRFPNLENKMKNLLGGDFADGKQAAGVILARVKDSGLDPTNMPDKVTVRQLRQFVQAVAVQLDLNKRLTAMINKTNANKKKLKKKIDAQKVHKQNEVLQYYAH